MGYLKINNLYKDQDILAFRECYALEKIHGTSAHIKYHPAVEGISNVSLTYFSGGENHQRFVGLFETYSDEPYSLENNLARHPAEKIIEALSHIQQPVTIYGEAYGGKQQGMSETYGKHLRFAVFDVLIGDNWLSVPDAADLAKQCGLEFVDYVKIPTELSAIDAERDKPSTQAIRNGVEGEKIREGVVLRPVFEVKKNNGSRIIAKHKREEFKETQKTRQVTDPSKLEVLTKANEVADEWVTTMRLVHVLDKMPGHSIEQMREILGRMVEDVKREGEGEIVWSKEIERAISSKTAKLYKEYLQEQLLAS